MFSQTEDFERCGECGHPYFKKEVSNVIRKVEGRETDTPVLVTKQITDFKCKKCNKLLSKFTNDSEPKLYG